MPYDFKKISTYWPIIVSALALTVTAASANTRLDNLKDRVDYIYANGPPAQMDRLARIETRLDEMSKTQDRISDKLDTIQARQDELYVQASTGKKRIRR